MTFIYPTTFPEACDLIGAVEESTGGTCTALVIRPREDFEILITRGGECVAPESLREPVTVCDYDNGDVLGERQFPTFLAAVMHIYGPIAEVSA